MSGHIIVSQKMLMQVFECMSWQAHEKGIFQLSLIGGICCLKQQSATKFAHNCFSVKNYFRISARSLAWKTLC